DVIEELVGEIYDEHDEVEELVKQVDENVWIVNGAENLAALFELVEKNTDTGEEFESTTVGGFVTELLKRIPNQGEEFAYENLKISVTKANSRKVLEVKVEVVQMEEDDEEERE
ncbi:MAG: HlyC/CorC family transporter, partial [Clostridia bacterium]|nr:HlyC/CorC family transporter [Clostridia bacterium]